MPTEIPRAPAGTRRRWWLEALLVVGLYEAFEWVRGQFEGPTGDAARHARQVIRVERDLGLFHEAAVQRAFLPHKTIVQAADVYYGTVHFVVPALVLVLLWRRAPAAYLRGRNTLMVLAAIALAGFVLYPLMPPRLLPAHYGFVDTAAVYGGMGKLDSGSMKDLNRYAAMPSLHIGWSTWSVIGLWPLLAGRRWARILAPAYPLLTLVVIVVTGNHYLLDAVGGWAALAIASLVAAGLSRLRPEGPPPPPRPAGAGRPRPARPAARRRTTTAGRRNAGP